MNARLLAEFRTPGAACRAKPFWSWNGKLDPAELRRQVRLLRRMGMGGFFMHARVGLATPYLSDAWFEAVRASVAEAREQGMEAWLYDEDRWPSGAAGGLVTRNPRHRMRAVYLAAPDSPRRLKWTRDTVAAFVARVDERGAASGVRRVPAGSRPRPGAGERLLVFTLAPDRCEEWFNGFTYLDTMDPAAVRRFIEVTHEAYRARCGRDFGRAMPGIFADEPHHGGVLGRSGHWGTGALRLPWTGRLPAVFRQRYGYDLADRLPELVFDVEGAPCERTRWHYHDCLTHLFVDAFSRPIFEWCARRRLLYTGHLLEEDTLSQQTHMVGSCMRSYEFMQAPGMDLLTERWRVFGTAKQVSSAARQFGRKWRLTETYGCTGWDFPFAGHKALGDWQVALGINLRCPHLSWYTMEGQAKRDYPAGIFYQSPWWTLYPKIEDYFARVLAVMTRGAEVRDLLVLHPVESVWTRVRSGWRQDPEVLAMDAAFVDVTNALLAGHVDFDYGDEEILSRHGRVARRGDAPPVFRVARAAYRAVLAPPMRTIRRSTLALLRRFRDAGGLVVFAGEPPPLVDAGPSGEAAAFAAAGPRAPAHGAGLVASVEAARRLRIADGEGREVPSALYLLREDREAYYLFVCNTGEDLSVAGLHPLRQPMVRERTRTCPDVRIRGLAGAAGTPQEWDPGSGRVAAARAERAGDGWEIRTSLPALGSRLFVVPKRKTAATRSAPADAAAVVRREPVPHDPAAFTLAEPNVLVLDRPRARIGRGAETAPEEVLRVDGRVREALGLPRRGGRMAQPWTRPPNPRPRRVAVRLAYDFEVRARPSGELCVAVERPAWYRATLNGAAIDTDADGGWWVDRSLRRLAVDPALLRIGPNELVLECDYSEAHPGLETVYLLGSFGVEVNGTAIAMTAAPRELRLGDWGPQGLPFYAGSVAYRAAIDPRPAPGERVFVEVPHFRGVAVRVLVDGREAGVIGWEPCEVEITALLGGAPAELQVEVIGHRRNSHGPLHLSEKWPAWTGPGEFTTSGDRWIDGYQLVPCGLLQPPVLSVRRA